MAKAKRFGVVVRASTSAARQVVKGMSLLARAVSGGGLWLAAQSSSALKVALNLGFEEPNSAYKASWALKVSFVGGNMVKSPPGRPQALLAAKFPVVEVLSQGGLTEAEGNLSSYRSRAA